ncbi:MAG: plasmid pRiA4b ORF-3 family protein [Dysgonamonadaceae bacterium]|jgi:hypothetical protein|nr:plasmid pRiA4b ORF-3 family protein [Dysgonamonadaceae bacterium]
MVYRFIIVSDEVDNFRRDIKIDSDATFLELHEAILDSVGYTKDQITSFFICDDEWSKGTEITLIDMESSSDEDIYVMESSRLSELLDEERQKLIYVFEPLTDRCFFIELREIIPGQRQAAPETVKAAGEPPKQISAVEDFTFAAPAATTGPDSDFIDDDFGMTDDYDAYNEEDLEDFSEDTYY